MITRESPQWDPDLYVPGQDKIRTGMTIFLYGAIGTIKTTWAATWPSPIFLSAGQEGGDDALTMLPSILNMQAPPCYKINSTKVMQEKVDFILRNYENYGWKTVVIDSITMYTDIFVSEVLSRQMAKGAPDPQMRIQDWGMLENHIVKNIAPKLHTSKLNVIWIATQKEKLSAPDRQGNQYLEGLMPMMSGASASKLPAICKMVIRADRQSTPGPNGKVIMTPIYYTEPTPVAKEVRHKYGNLFSEGCLVDPEYGTWPTFRAIDSRIGHLIYK